VDSEKCTIFELYRVVCGLFGSVVILDVFVFVSKGGPLVKLSENWAFLEFVKYLFGPLVSWCWRSSKRGGEVSEQEAGLMDSEGKCSR
jgi:hypothetical protein